MIKDNQKMLNRVHVVLDVIVTIATYILSYYIKFYSPLTNLELFNMENKGFLPISEYARQLYYVVPGYLILYYYAKMYTPKRIKHKWLELYHIIQANAVGVIIFGFLIFSLKIENVSRLFVGIFVVLNTVTLYLIRIAIANILKFARKKGYNLKHILLVGYSRSAESYIDRILANPQWGYYIHGILDNNLEAGTMYKKIPVIGSIYNLETFLSKMVLDEIAITLSISEYDKLEQIVHICEKSGVHIKFVPDYYHFIPTKPYTEDLNGLPVINIRNVPLSNTFNRVVKRFVDLFGAIAALFIFSIPMLLVALLIKLTSKGPIIYSQIRVGKHNRQFRMYKFRSMELQPDNDEMKAWTVKKDPRVTGIGKFIRRTSIDELPQLFNILKGEMSLVGPRPERPFFVEKFKEEIPRYMIKHQVSPGLTGWAQINGYRGDTSIRKRIEYDLYYIENWTLGLDFRILFLTIFKGFINRNAY